MPEIPSSRFPRRALIAGILVAVVAGGAALDNLRLRSNLKSTTRITQGLRDELDGLRKQTESFKERELKDQTQVQTLSEQLNTLQQDKSLSSGIQEDLKKKVEGAERKLDDQNGKIAQLESKLREAEEKMKRQKKNSANLEEQTRSARANPGMTQEYVKIVESEWLAAVAKTEDVEKDLQKTLGELSGQNKERSKLRNETATMHYNLAVILTEQRNFPAAILEYQKVLESRPNDADAHYNLAVIYDDYVKNNEKALEHYREYVKAAPESPEAQKVRQWIQDKEYDTAMKFKL